MVNDFSFVRTPEIHFGQGKIWLLPSLVSRYGKNVLVVTGARSFIESIHYERLVKEFKKNSLKHYVIKISGEPAPQLIDSIVNEYLLKDIDLVVAIGGGSVLDTGKAVAAMLSHDGFVQEYLEGVGTGRHHPGRKLPFIAVPTTAGTGSETTMNAVLSFVGEQGFKKSLRHESFVPDVAIVDPELTLTCPANITAACGMDAFTQLLESYVSIHASPMTESLCLSGLYHVNLGLIKAVEEPDNIRARSDMAYASMISGIALANAGLGVVHGFASVIGGYYDIPHGVICGTLMGAATRTNINSLQNKSGVKPALEKYTQAGRIFSGSGNKKSQLNGLASKIDEWIERLKIPALGQYGIQIADLKKIVSETGQKQNPVKLSEEEMLEILKERI